MKLHVSNMGRIKDAHIDIAPLTVFVGPNNTNKTWTAYALYGILSAISTRKPAAIFQGSKDNTDLVSLDVVLLENIDRFINTVTSFLTASTDSATLSIEVTRSELLNGVTFPIKPGLFSLNLAYILGLADESINKDAIVTLEISESEFDNQYDKVAWTIQKTEQQNLVTTRITYKDGRSTNSNHLFGAQHLLNLLTTHVTSTIRQLVLPSYMAIPFPSERKALSTMSDLIAEIARPNRVTNDKAAIEKNTSKPVRDYLNMVVQTTNSNVPRQLRKNVFIDIVGSFESQVLGGSIDVVGDSLPRRFEYTLPDKSSLRLQGTSSLVKSLSGFDLYLSRFAQSGDMVVIDEPEMNAHPSAQLAIAELLTMLVNRGIRIVVTTHSPYIVDQINNLVAGDLLSDDKKDLLSKKLALQNTTAFIARDKVSVYRFEETGEVKNAYDESTNSFDISTFSNMTDRLGSLYADILDAKS